ncbi:MAG: 1,6-anhydro-N-acetylmuramyl-L-alanine amidase AmpD [Gammaproteobacteria bacterium]|nr:1,6-anhydro-N-acetylmuramyl-L-alanine amidase AmpD [Gammaproteobacteria bacterium]
MIINKKTGLLEDCQQVMSPNMDDRPENMRPELLVIHNISLPPGEFGGPYIDQLFCNQLAANEHPYFTGICDLRVSSHLLIRRDGEIIQYVPFHKRAWHAGESSYQGRSRCNDFSIGIELEGSDDTPYEDIQYRQLADMIRLLRENYPDIAKQAITGHCDIAPGRKTDPGESFDWDKLQQLLE